MKHFLVLLTFAFLTASCDDGDLIVDNFDFDAVNIEKCTDSNILFKISKTEALILNTPEVNFENAETPLNQPRVIAISGTTSIIYRNFAATPTSNTICGALNIAVLEEWVVNGGSLEVITKKILGPDGITIVAYNHNMVFKNVTFVTNNKQVTYPVYNFGNFRTEVINLAFDFTTATTQRCTNTKLIFKYNTTKVLLLDLDPSLFANVVTPANSPRTALIDGTTNKVIYRVYSGNLSNTFFCSSFTPTTPSLIEEWIAENGVSNVSGIIKVTTVATANPLEFKHTIVLNKTTFRKGIYNYSPAPNGDYIFGELVTN